MKIRFVTSQLKSQSLKDLAKGLSNMLGYKVWRSNAPKPKRRNIQYGDCKDKIYQYQWFAQQEIPALVFTTDHSIAKTWCEEGEVAICRTLTRASEGKGIVIAEEPEQLVVAPVYTKYKKKKKEFRVHIFEGKVVHVLEKRKKAGDETKHSLVRNLANGYVFCSENVVEPDGLRELAVKASKVTASSFAGVDIGYNEKKNELFVIEVNSAPGIQGTNIQRYISAIVGE